MENSKLLPAKRFFEFHPNRQGMAQFLLLGPLSATRFRCDRETGGTMDNFSSDFSNDTATWLEDRFVAGPQVECELGSLIAAASDWTEDEMEMDDLVCGLVESGQIALQIG